jgi:hypothetical protein
MPAGNWKRFEPRRLEIAARELQQRHRPPAFRRPRLFTVERLDRIAVLHVDDLRALIGRARVDVDRDRAAAGVEAGVGARGHVAGDRVDALGSAERRHVLGEDLLDAVARVGEDLHRVRVVHQLAVLNGEARNVARTILSPMAGEAAHTRLPAEVLLVDRLHHDDHLPRTLDLRRGDRERGTVVIEL